MQTFAKLNKCFNRKTVLLLSSHLVDCLCHVLSFGISTVYLVFQVWPHFLMSLLPNDHIPLAWPQHSLAFGGPCPDDPNIPADGSSTGGYHTRITRRDELLNQGFPGLRLGVSTHLPHYFSTATQQSRGRQPTSRFHIQPQVGLVWVGRSPVALRSVPCSRDEQDYVLALDRREE